MRKANKNLYLIRTQNSSAQKAAEVKAATSPTEGKKSAAGESGERKL